MKPSQKKKREIRKDAAVSFMLESELKEQFEAIAIADDRPVSSVFRAALKAFLESRRPAAAA